MRWQHDATQRFLVFANIHWLAGLGAGGGRAQHLGHSLDHFCVFDRSNYLRPFQCKYKELSWLKGRRLARVLPADCRHLLPRLHLVDHRRRHLPMGRHGHPILPGPGRHPSPNHLLHDHNERFRR